jgi:hypothetical protein
MSLRVLLTVLLGILAVVGAIPAMFAPMMFDAPGSEKNVATRILAVSAMTWPVSCVVAIGLAWFLRGRGDASLWLFLLPLLNVVAGAAAWCWISVVQGGQFNG